MNVGGVWMTGAWPLLDPDAPEELKASLRRFYRSCFTHIEQYVHFKDFEKWEGFGGPLSLDECHANSNVRIWGNEVRISAADRIRLTEEMGLKVQVNLDCMYIDGQAGYHRYFEGPWHWPLSPEMMAKYALVAEEIADRGWALQVMNEPYYRKPGTGWPDLDYDSLYGDLLREVAKRDLRKADYLLAASGPWVADPGLRSLFDAGWHEIFHDSPTPEAFAALLRERHAQARRGVNVHVNFDELGPVARNPQGTKSEWGADMYEAALRTAHSLGADAFFLADYEVGSEWDGFHFLVLADGTWTPTAERLAAVVQELGIVEPPPLPEPPEEDEMQTVDPFALNRLLRLKREGTDDSLVIDIHRANWTNEEVAEIQDRANVVLVEAGEEQPGPPPVVDNPTDADLAAAARKLISFERKAVRVESGGRLYAEWRRPGESDHAPGSPKQFAATEAGFVEAVRWLEAQG